MKQPDCILTQPMKASLQDFAVALFTTDVLKFWVCGWDPKVWNLFYNNRHKVKYFLGAILFGYLITAPMNDAHSDVTITTPNLRIQLFPRRGAGRNGCIRRLAKCGTKLKHFMNTPERSCQKHMAEIYKCVHICCSSGVLELAHPFEVATPSPRPNIIK